MRAVAGAEPAAIVAAAEGRHAAQVGAGADQDQPLGLARLVARLIGGGVPKGCLVVLDGRGDFRAGTVPDEQGLSAPLDGYGLAELNLRQVELHRGQGEGVAGGVHLVDEWPGHRRRRTKRRDARRNVNKIASAGVIPILAMFGVRARHAVGHFKATLRLGTAPEGRGPFSTPPVDLVRVPQTERAALLRTVRETMSPRAKGLPPIRCGPRTARRGIT